MASLTHYTVVVAGAGPAGCAAALALQQAGVRVCLVDNALPNGPKVGESLPGAIGRLLHRLGIEGLGELLPDSDFRACMATMSAWGSDQWAYQDALANPDGGGWHVNRSAFDAALRWRAHRAGIPFYQKQIIDLQPITFETSNETGYLINLSGSGHEPHTIRATWLVDATGRRAFVSRRLQMGRQKLDDQTAAVCWIAARPTDYDHTTRIKSVANGWWYTARLPWGHRVVCFHGLPTTVATFCRNPTGFLRQFNAAGVLSEPVDEAQPMPIRATDASVTRCLSVAQPGFLCVGDAALTADPLSSQGVFFALYSGIKGAEALVQSLAAPTLTTAALMTYQQQVDAVFAANQRSRMYFYTSEYRYATEPYWQSRFVEKQVLASAESPLI